MLGQFLDKDKNILKITINAINFSYKIPNDITNKRSGYLIL